MLLLINADVCVAVVVDVVSVVDQDKLADLSIAFCSSLIGLYMPVLFFKHQRNILDCSFAITALLHLQTKRKDLKKGFHITCVAVWRAVAGRHGGPFQLSFFAFHPNCRDLFGRRSFGQCLNWLSHTISACT